MQAFTGAEVQILSIKSRDPIPREKLDPYLIQEKKLGNIVDYTYVTFPMENQDFGANPNQV